MGITLGSFVVWHGGEVMSSQLLRIDNLVGRYRIAVLVIVAWVAAVAVALRIVVVFVVIVDGFL